MSDDRLIESVLEADGSLTFVCERPDGTRYRLLGVELTSYESAAAMAAPGVEVRPVTLKIVRSVPAEEER